MGEASRIRATVQGTGALVRVLMAHPMETGRRKNADGLPVPVRHIAEVTASLNGVAVLRAQWGPGVSQNPYWQFMLKRAAAGDRVTIAWTDNQGDSRSDEAVIG